MAEVDPKQLEAMCRLLEQSGDLTPMGTYQLMKLVK